MMAAFWTAEKDKHLRRLEAAGLSAAQIADRLGTTRGAVIGRSVRLRGLVFPLQLKRQRTERTLQAERLHQQRERTATSLASMRRVITRGTPRDVAIVSAARAHVTYQAIADELGLTKQRVQQIVARSATASEEGHSGSLPGGPRAFMTDTTATYVPSAQYQQLIARRKAAAERLKVTTQQRDAIRRSKAWSASPNTSEFVDRQPDPHGARFSCGEAPN